MGAKESKSCCITYEEALKRVNKHEFKRLEEAFKQEALRRSSAINTGFISKYSFVKEILGDYVPPAIAECIYVACGGTAKGIGFKELLCGLVLFTRGKFEEKCQFLFNIYSNEAGNNIIKNDLIKFLNETEHTESIDSFNSLFDTSDKVTHDVFFDWLVCNREATSLSRWLLSESSSVSLNNEMEMPTFYQTLAGVTHLEEADIIELEKLYWSLKKYSKSGKLDLETLLPLISPPVPLNICKSFFNVFDENRDGHIDFKEMACGISAACRGPLTERQKFCFKIFDTNHDGVLSEEEIHSMIDTLLFVYHENSVTKQFIDRDVVMEDIRSHRSGEFLTVEEYVMWTVHNNFSMDFLNLIFQVCHIVLGLKPISRQEEGNIVKGWMRREERRGYAVGQFWYLVSYDWWSIWENYVNMPPNRTMNSGGSLSIECNKSDNNCKMNGRAYSMPFLTSSSSSSLSSQSNSSSTQRGPSGKPGPIDNSAIVTSVSNKVVSLTGEGGKLKCNLVRGEDYELVPDSLWKSLLRWYGGSLPLARQVIQPSEDSSHVELELYPLTLKILKHQLQTNTPRTTYVQPSSWSGMVGGYGAAALISTSSYSYASNATVIPKRYVAYTATFSRMATIKHVYNFVCDHLRIRPEDIRLWHFHDEDNMLLIEDEDITLELLGVCDDDRILLEIRNKDQTWPEEMGSLALNSGDRNKRVPTERGATGLNNLGNTCFMNAALQCVSNTQALTLYFTNNMHLYELNRTNPLGMKGHIAKRYGDLIHDIWSGTAKTIAPLKLRWTIGKYAPRFNGFQQHDSQELLAFLLDGLHEDLNRVQDKPYLELKDSECRPDVAVAQEAWENHILRNKSIIVDLFHGQLKSKVTCKHCGHESVRFDPFNYLSLPLPMESYVYVQVAVIKLNGSVPVRYTLRLNADDKYLNVKHQLMQHCSIPIYLLKLVEVASSQFRTILPDDRKIKSTNGNGMLYAYELPSSCNSSGSVSGDEERLSITSIKSTHREAAQTFTAIQRSVRPCPQNHLGITNGNHQHRTISEDSCDSAINSNSSSGGEICCSESGESNSSPADCSEILLEEMSGRLTVDSGHCSASSASLADSTDTNNSTPQQPPYIIALHRKLVRQDVYFVSSQRSKPSLFGIPLIVPCNENTTHCELYQSVWLQVARFVSPLPPSEVTTLNHAMDCDDSLGYEFPFLLKAVNKDGIQCAWCPWYRFCRGCQIQCCDAEFCFSSSYIAIDWDPTALHLRYQTSQENKYEYVGDNSKILQSEPIDLTSCLEAFTTEEHLSDDEKYYCSKCKEHQLASKKLQIWRLPPILIIHLKRFQFVNGKWVKSQKVVKFPFKDFDITNYLAAVPRETIKRYRQIISNKGKRKDPIMNEPIDMCANDFNGISSEEDDTTILADLNDKLPTKDPLNCIDNNESGRIHTSEIQKKRKLQQRRRLESTSLTRTPIDDTALQDFHQHRLRQDINPFDLRYNLYAIVSHSGILGGGHYVSYANNPNGKWYCYNDSSCKEVSTDMDTSSAYMLFYERVGLSNDNYMPNVIGKKPLDINDLDQDFESDYKKMCHLM